MRAHTITTNASTIVLGGILALSFAVVLLAATASTASAERALGPWYCPPPSPPPTTFTGQVRQCLDDPFGDPACPGGCGRFEGFGDRQVGTTSPAQRFALGVSNDTFTPDISVSGDYAQTNDCPPTLSAGAFPQIEGCQITVTFAPTSTGPRNGTLSTGPGGPTVALTGNGVTTPTPWDWPLKLLVPDQWDYWSPSQGVLPARALEKREPKVALRATTNTDSKLVVSGGVKKTTKQLKAGKETKFKAKLNLKRLKVKPSKVKGLKDATTEIKFAATDEFDRTATEKRKFTFCVGTERDCTAHS
jgi:hypothetical protein